MKWDYEIQILIFGMLIGSLGVILMDLTEKWYKNKINKHKSLFKRR